MTDCEKEAVGHSVGKGRGCQDLVQGRNEWQNEDDSSGEEEEQSGPDREQAHMAAQPGSGWLTPSQRCGLEERHADEHVKDKRKNRLQRGEAVKRRSRADEA